MAFTDNFQRADGPLGPNWAYSSLSHTVTGGRPRFASGGYDYYTGFASVGSHDASVTIDTLQTLNSGAGPVVKMSETAGLGYKLSVYQQGTGYAVSIVKGATASAAISTAVHNTALPNPTTLRLTYSNGTLSGYVNGVMEVFARDADYDANLRVGISLIAQGQQITSFTTDTPAATQFRVSPTWAQVSGEPILITLTGVGTVWTPGTPGAPIFTVSAGSLSGQSVSSPTSATAWFTPPMVAGTAVVTDPSTGLSVSITISNSNPGGGGGGFAPLLTPEGAATLNRTEVIPGPQTAITDLSVVIPGLRGMADLTFLNAISDLWYAHYSTWAAGPPTQASAIGYILWQLTSGGYEPAVGPWLEPSHMPLMHQLDLLRTFFWDGDYGRNVTTGEIRHAIELLGAPDLTDIRNDLGVWTQFIYPSVLEAIRSTRGDDVSSILGVLSELGYIRSNHGYTLESVMDAIAGVTATVDLSPVLNAIAALRGGTATVQNAKDLADTIHGVVDNLWASLYDLRDGEAHHTIQTVLDAIANIHIPEPTPVTYHRVYQAEIPFTEPFERHIACDGVRYTLVGSGQAVKGFAVGTQQALTGGGVCAFLDENGDGEPFQYLNWRRGVMLPRGIVRPTGFLWSPNRHLTGVVTPFTLQSD